MHIKNFQLAWGILFLRPSITFARYLRQLHSDPVQLCFDLSSANHGQFGKQTLEVANDHAQWFLGLSDVSFGSCKAIEKMSNERAMSKNENKNRDIAIEEMLNERMLREVTYCKHIGSAKSGWEFELQAPRYLESFLSENGAGRGECMDAVDLSDMKDLARHSQSSHNDDTVPLCFDLREYGKQTISMSKKGSKWFLFDDEVTKGPCGRTGEVLDHHETEMVTYCKHFGSAKNGYEYEIRAPRFLSDYLHKRKGSELGECSDSEPGSVSGNYVPEFFASITGDIGKLVDKPKPNNNNVNPKPKPGNASRPNNKPSSWSSGEFMCECEDKPNKIKPSSSKNESSKSNKNKPKPRPNRSKSSKAKGKPGPRPDRSSKSKNKPRPDKSSSKSKDKPKPNKSKNKPKPRPDKTTSRSKNKPTANNNNINSFGSTGGNSNPSPNPPSPNPPSPNPPSPNPPPTPKPTEPENESCNDCICDSIKNGFIQRPNTDCKEFVQCYEGCVSQILSCGGGLIFDSNLKICNWEGQAVCGSDPPCGV